MRMVMEGPGEGEGDDMAELLQAMAGGAGGAGGLPPGVVQVRVWAYQCVCLGGGVVVVRERPNVMMN